MTRRSNGEGSISQRQDGRWQASLQVEGRRRTVYGRTRGEVAKRLDELRRQASLSGTLPDPGKRTLGDLLDAWLDAKAPTWHPRTLRDHVATCERYIRPALGLLPLAKVTPDRIARLYTKIQAAGRHRTALKCHQVLAPALALAVRWAWLASNPCDRVERPKWRPERRDVWTPGELLRFLDGTREHWLHPLWVVLACSGCRLGEALALEWADVDLRGGTLTIAKAKTPAGVRTVTLPRDAVEALRRQAVWRLAHGHGGPAVFSGERSGGPLHPTTAEQAMRRECRRLALPPLTPHGLRHLHASLLLSEGLSVPEVSRRMGHAHSGVTMAVYAHVVSPDDGAAADAMARALGRG